MDLFLELLKLYGIPLTMLIALAAHHIRTLKVHRDELAKLQENHDKAVKAKAEARAEVFAAKDAEIHRLQEERLNQVELSYERSMEVAQEANALNMETTASLKAVADELAALRPWLPQPPTR